jgi:hypothetical protein
MTTKSDFNAEEWERVAQAPALAALMVMLADRGGAIRESVALGRAYAEARRDAGSELIEQLVSSAPHLDPASIGQPEQLHSELPARIHDAVAVVDAKATPEEAHQYRQFLLRVADVVAHAAKEGGVLGIGGKEVSEHEQAVLDDLAAQLAAHRRQAHQRRLAYERLARAIACPSVTTSLQDGRRPHLRPTAAAA